MKRSIVVRFLPPLLLGLGAAPILGQEETPEEEPERGLRVHEEGAFVGYTIIAPLSSDQIYLVDMEGEVVHSWAAQNANGSVYFLENGNLLRCSREPDNPRFNGGGIGGRVQEIDWEGNVVWDFVFADDYQTQHHDVEPLPNGNILLIAWENRFQEDAIAWGRDPEHVGTKGFWPDAVFEVRPTRPEGGEVVWEWHAWDHVIQDFDPSKENYGSIPERPERIDINADHRDLPPMTEEERRRQEELEAQMRALGYVGDDDDPGSDPTAQKRPDWLHTNAVEYHPEFDLIALSVPHLGEIWVIDHSTTTEDAQWDSGGRWGKGGDLLYRWGNPRTYGAGSEADQKLFYQHNPEWVPGKQPGELRLLIFNNGGGGPGSEYSTVDEIVLPFDPDKGFLREAGQAYGPAEPAWSYSAPGEFYSGFISGAQRLPNGNTLICSGAPGRVFEVTPEGKIVWDYLNPHSGTIQTGQGGNAPPIALFRATRIAPDHPGLGGRL